MITDLKPYPAMKDSGVEWLGEVPEHWEMERGKNLFTKVERPVRESDEVVTCFRDGTVTLRKNRRTQGFTESLKEIGYQGIRVGDLVIHAMDAFAGAVGVADSEGKGTPVYAVCEAKENADPFYHAFVIREMARSQWILALATGIRERSTDFRFGTYASQRLPLPPLPEQAAIVRYLDHVDRRVRRLTRAKRKLIALLTEQKQAIIHRAVTRGLDPDVPLKDSGVEWLGEVPEHWEVLPLTAVGRPKSIAGLDGRELLSVYLDRGVIRFSDVQEKRTNVTSEDLSKYQAVDPGDFVLNNQQAWRGSVGVSRLTGIVSPAYLVLALSDKLNAEFANLLFRERAMVSQYLIASRGVGSIQRNLYWPHLKRAITLVPPLSEQVAIVEHLDQATADIDTTITRAEREIELLGEYRTRLVADVVTGKLDVRDTAAALPDVDPLAEAEDADELDADLGMEAAELDEAPEKVEA